MTVRAARGFPACRPLHHLQPVSRTASSASIGNASRPAPEYACRQSARRASDMPSASRASTVSRRAATPPDDAPNAPTAACAGLRVRATACRAPIASRSRRQSRSGPEPDAVSGWFSDRSAINPAGVSRCRCETPRASEDDRIVMRDVAIAADRCVERTALSTPRPPAAGPARPASRALTTGAGAGRAGISSTRSAIRGGVPAFGPAAVDARCSRNHPSR
ncbi:hypothetical protein BLA50215_06663 [Burkholderia lata]|nr:hypothetical protein BLA50215_06663 [Burkholderia lata]